MEADDKFMHYQTLGLSSLSSKEEIKKAYRKLAKKYHPDVNTEDPNAEKRFKGITTAYHELMSIDESQPEERVANEESEHSRFHKRENVSKSGARKYAYQHSSQHNMDGFETREKAEKNEYKGRNYSEVRHGTREEQAYRARMMKRASKRKGRSSYKVPAFVRLAMYFVLAMFSGILLIYLTKHKGMEKFTNKQPSPIVVEEGYGDEVPGNDMLVLDNDNIIGNLQDNIIIDMREKREQAWREEWTDDNTDSPERRMQEKEMERTYSMKNGEEAVSLY